MTRTTLGLLLVLLLPFSLVDAQSTSPNRKLAPYDIAAVKERLRVITDNHGHYIVLVPFSRCGANRKISDLSDYVFYGDGKTFYRVPLRGGSADCSQRNFSHILWDPRIAHGSRRQVMLTAGSYKVHCRDRTTTLQEVPEQAGRALIDAASFFDAPWDRQPHRLARDDHGRYYLIDVRRDGTDHRMWVGPRGKLKQQKMKNIVTDSEGEVYATASGELRLVLNKSQIVWIQGKKRTDLVSVPIDDNLAMIYNDLGVYDEKLGTPCDDF